MTTASEDRRHYAPDYEDFLSFVQVLPGKPRHFDHWAPPELNAEHKGAAEIVGYGYALELITQVRADREYSPQGLLWRIIERMVERGPDIFGLVEWSFLSALEDFMARGEISLCGDFVFRHDADVPAPGAVTAGDGRGESHVAS